MPEFLRIVDKAINGSIATPGYEFSRSDLISLFHANFEDNSLFSEVLDLSFYYGFMDAADKSKPIWEKYYLTLRGREYLENPEAFSLDELKKARHLQEKIDCTDWTGLAKRISPAQKIAIRSKANELLALVVQSDADEETRLDACKRVEAIVALLEAPNSPWREIVSLLTHPVLNAFFAATSLAQFILGMTN